jgi:hypothetical protein
MVSAVFSSASDACRADVLPCGRAAAEQGATVVYSRKSGASLWDLAGFDEQFEAARARSLPIVRELVRAAAARRSRPEAAVAGR